MPYTYDYPRPMVTVDIFLLRLRLGKLQLLLIQRDNQPFAGKWALPGGYVEPEESLEAAAHRELVEETGLRDVSLRQMGAYGDPERDPRGRTITVVFGGFVPAGTAEETTAGDDARRTRWVAVDRLPPLAFDHRRITRDCLEQFQSQTLFKFWQ